MTITTINQPDHSDPFDLTRFLTAQDRVYPTVIKELRNGQKTSHWIWFIFPQLDQLGHSYNSKFYGIHSIEEARAYAAHPILWGRYRECVQILLELPTNSARDLLGRPDDKKVLSSLTLFLQVAPDDQLILGLLNKFYPDKLCRRTLAYLKTNE